MASQDERDIEHDNRSDLSFPSDDYGAVNNGYGDPRRPTYDDDGMLCDTSVPSTEYQDVEQSPRDLDRDRSGGARLCCQRARSNFSRKPSRDREYRRSSAFLSDDQGMERTDHGTPMGDDYNNLTPEYNRSKRNQSVDSFDDRGREESPRSYPIRGRSGRSRGRAQRGGNRGGRGRFQPEPSYDGSRRLSISSYGDNSRHYHTPSQDHYSPAHPRDRDSYRSTRGGKRRRGNQPDRREYFQVGTSTAPSEDHGRSHIPMRPRPTPEPLEPSPRIVATSSESHGDTQQGTNGMHPDRLKFLAQQEQFHQRPSSPPPRQTRDRKPSNREIVQPYVLRTSESSFSNDKNDKAASPSRSGRGLSAEDGHQWVRDMDSSGKDWGWAQGRRGRGRGRGRGKGRGGWKGV